MALDLNQHVVADVNDNTFHSNGFATVANGNHVGAVSTETFEQRRKLEEKRQIINGYRHSNLGNTYASSQVVPTAVMPEVPSINQITPPGSEVNQS